MAELTMPVALIGDGDRFDSLTALLQANGCDVRTWLPTELSASVPQGATEIEIADLADTPLIYLAVPLTSLRAIARQIGDVISARHAVVHACHNLEAGSLATASQVLLDELPTRRFGFVTGPMRPDDVGRGLPASGVCASRYPEVWELAERSLVHDRFRLYRSRDLLGAEHAAAYGRVIAMGAGVASQMKLGESVQATLFARGLAEVGRWVSHRGGDGQTTFGIAGAGNLYLDMADHGSVDFRVGADAMATGKFDPVAVGKKFGSTGRDLLDLVESLWAGVRDSRVQSHILETCHLMVSGELDPQGAVMHLMTLPTLDD